MTLTYSIYLAFLYSFNVNHHKRFSEKKLYQFYVLVAIYYPLRCIFYDSNLVRKLSIYVALLQKYHS